MSSFDFQLYKRRLHVFGGCQVDSLARLIMLGFL